MSKTMYEVEQRWEIAVAKYDAIKQQLRDLGFNEAKPAYVLDLYFNLLTAPKGRKRNVIEEGKLLRARFYRDKQDVNSDPNYPIEVTFKGPADDGDVTRREWEKKFKTLDAWHEWEQAKYKHGWIQVGSFLRLREAFQLPSYNPFEYGQVDWTVNIEGDYVVARSDPDKRFFSIEVPADNPRQKYAATRVRDSLADKLKLTKKEINTRSFLEMFILG